MSDQIPGYPTPVHDEEANRAADGPEESDDKELVVDPAEFGDPLLSPLWDVSSSDDEESSDQRPHAE